jgi:hypothetical protein
MADWAAVQEKPTEEEKWLQRLALDKAGTVLDHAKAGRIVTGLPVTIPGLAVNQEIALIGIPAEVFVEIGLAVIEGSPFKKTIVASCTNGALGYIPIAEAFGKGGYEVDVRASHQGLRITSAAAEVLVRECLEALRRLHAR